MRKPRQENDEFRMQNDEQKRKLIHHSSFIVHHSFVFLLVVALGAASQAVFAQVASSGKLTGLVTDPARAVIPDAEIVVTNEASNAEFKTKTNAEGYFTLVALPVASYSVTVTAPGFKTTVLQGIRTSAGSPVDLNIKLEPGTITEEVTVTGSGGVLLNKTSETVSSTITGRQITELPFTSRDALDLVLALPGTATPGRPRTSSINGLPKGAINISMDGINIQDNLLRSSDGFFAYIRPRIDAVEEVTVVTSNPGAGDAGDGAVQIKFVTKSGTNEWHGGAWWYHRNTALNSNYFFNNQAGIERQRIILNQFGGKVGGPIIKNKFWFFYSHDEYRNPDSRSRTATIFKEEVTRGLFTYQRRDTGQLHQVNILALAAQNGFEGTVDPQIGDFLNQIQQARSLGGITPTDLFRDSLTFNNLGRDRRTFPTLRLDLAPTDKLHWEGIVHYQYFNAFPDFLNGLDPPLPGLSLMGGGQKSNRFEISTALRYTISPTMINEFRFGLTGGSVGFATEIGPGDFPGGLNLNFPLVTDPFTVLPGSRRNTPVKQWIDNFTWTRGKHNLSFGSNVTLITSWIESFGTFGGNVLPSVNFGVLATDPVNEIFNVQNFPGINTATDLPTARALYALLVGRITSASAGIAVNEDSLQFEQGIPQTERNRHVQYGFYAQDSWRARPSLTLNFGLRWEYQGPPKNTNKYYTTPNPDGTGQGFVFGISGEGNIFRPGVLEGTPTEFFPLTGSAYNSDWNNFAPSFGLSWSPEFTNPWLRSVFGSGGKTVFRGGYGITFVREGLIQFNGFMLGPNPGAFAEASLTADVDFPSGSILMRNGLPLLKRFPESRTFPIPLSLGQFRFWSVNAYGENIRTPYVQQWSFGIQREIMRDTVLEFTYVGNRGVKLFRQIQINEVNVFENGFLQEFLAAQNNLTIARQMFGAGSSRGENFSFQRLAGQVNLPIMETAWGGFRSPQFRNADFIAALDNGEAGRLANTLATTASFFERLVAAGYPPNFFIANPGAATGGSFLMFNGGDSTYHALQVEFRRRLSRGLLVQANYTFSKALSNLQNVSSVVFQNYRTIRNPALDKGLSPFDINHAFKANWIWELPFGPGQRWGSSSDVVNKLIGGWEFHGLTRIQSGAPFQLTSGRLTFNAGIGGGHDPGVILKNGLTREQLQKMLKIRKTPDGLVFFFPEQLVNPVSGLANSEFIDSPRAPGEFGQFVFLHGPKFIRFDLSMTKKTWITEKTNLEFRAEFLNAFNHTNFLFGRSATQSSAGAHSINSTTFGRITAAYQDTSTTDDPGGRLIQFVLRFNF
jgi:hypothetical protein